MFRSDSITENQVGFSMDLHPEKALELMEKNKDNKDLTVLNIYT
jgi:hypothetical protein